jgi:hypothetical protein
VLSSNGFMFTVNYLYLLPFKKPSWVQVVEEGKHSHVKSIASDIYNSQMQSKRMKMSYEYVRIS